MSIYRCPHDRENPYAQISRELIRDKSISFECRAFIIYCLSYDPKWEISIPYFIKEQEISKDRMYRILDEAIDAGYIYREEHLEGNLKRYRYLVCEYPKFKKSFRYPENQDPGIQDPENQDSTNKQSYKETTKEKASSIPLSPSKPEKAGKSPKENAAAAFSKENLWKELKKSMTAEEFEHGWQVYEARKTKVDRPPGFILTAGKIKYTLPYSLNLEENNLEFIEKIANNFSDEINRNQIVIGYNYVEFPWSNGGFRFLVTEKGFRECVISQLRKMNLNVKNL